MTFIELLVDHDENMAATLTITARDEDINLSIGIGEVEATLDFYEMSVSTLNTFSKSEAEGFAKEGNFTIKNVIPVKVDTIFEVLQQYNNNLFLDFSFVRY